MEKEINTSIKNVQNSVLSVNYSIESEHNACN